MDKAQWNVLTHGYAIEHNKNQIKFADDGTVVVVGLISNSDKSAYREEVEQLADWCKDNNLFLIKQKEDYY